MNALRQPVFAWMYENLLSSKLNIGLTLLTVLLLWYSLPPLFEWMVLDATLAGDSSAACKTVDDAGQEVDAPGACWVFVKVRMPQFLFGLWYTRNPDEIWRPVLAFFLLLATFGVLTTGRLPQSTRRHLAAGALLAYPLIAYALLNGSWLGLPVARTSEWGGLSLTLVLAVVGIIAALPIGIVLALARQSNMPAVKWVAVAWIELFRGTPLITILFFASVMLPLFFSGDVNLDKVLRAIIGITLFQSAYTAEAIRGGLAAIPRGQYEAAASLGMGYWKSTFFIVMPQALKISIPAIVNSFIELYKDTSLVLIIGLLDLLNTVTLASRSVQWKGYDSEGYVFAAAVYFIFCYGMSKYSQGLERTSSNTLTGRRVAQD